MRGKIEADARVAEKLYHRACGYSHEAVKIFLPSGTSKPIYAPYTKHFPPDANAAFRWLMNRQPNIWRDRKEIEHTGTVEQRILAMTPEERMADAVALVERIRARLRMPDAQLIEHEEEESSEGTKGIERAIRPPERTKRTKR